MFRRVAGEDLHRRWKFVCSNNICGQLKPDRNSTADVFDSDKRVVLQTARYAIWQDPLTRLGLSVTPQDEQPEAPTALQDQQWRRMRKGTLRQLRAGVERTRIVAHHCIHPSRVRSGLRMTRTAPVDPLSHSVSSRVKPLFVAWTISMDSIVDWSRMCEMVCRFWFVCHFSVAGLSHEISTRWEKCPAVDESGCEHSRLQEAHFPDPCQCFDVKTITATLVSTPTISEFSWILRGVDCRHQQSHVAVKTSSRFFGISTIAIASAPSLDSDREEFGLCCHHINNYSVRFSGVVSKSNGQNCQLFGSQLEACDSGSKLDVSQSASYRCRS